MNNNNPLKMRVAITMLPKLNSVLYLPLFERCGGIEGFFKESKTALEATYRDFNIHEEFDRQTALIKAEQELKEMEKHQIEICTFEDPHFPQLLLQCPDTPLAFFHKGKLETEDKTYLAIVGTRKASERCKSRVEIIIQELCQMGHRPVIVSGLAFGIDASAHTASLKNNLKTYAVLGHGLHMIYPAAHKNLSEKILATGGALISEFPCSASIHPGNFLQRNRIVAGLCQATLIAESAEKGGAMATARIALSYNRDVMTFPGRPEDKMSSGCNQLIKENIAALVENGTDVAQILHLTCEKQTYRQATLNLFDIDDNEALIIRIISEKNNVNIDELSILTRISVNELSAILLQLELEEKIMSLPGKNYAVC